MAKPCEGSSILTFVLSVAFTPPLLKYAGLDSGGFNIFGTSSKGKTTALQVAASVWGNAADPATADDSHIDSWNTTSNALEATAAARNDGLLLLDELGVCDAKNFDRAIYGLFQGRGKTRMDKRITLQPRRSWRIQVLSSGEISIWEKLHEEGRKVRAGILNRMLDIPIVTEIFPEQAGKSPAQIANALKSACRLFYGTAGPAFIDMLIACEPDSQSLQARIKDEIDTWENDLKEGLALESFQQRALRRLACVLVSGLKAIDFEILPFQKPDLIRAIFEIRDTWLGCKENSSEPVQGLRSLREFILRHQYSRFGNCSETVSGPGFRTDSVNSRNNIGIRDLAGYFVPEKQLVLFTDDGLREACGKHNIRDVLHEAQSRGYLRHDHGRLKTKLTIPGTNHRAYLYAFRLSMLEDEV